jgi:hypothetical protein
LVRPLLLSIWWLPEVAVVVQITEAVVVGLVDCSKVLLEFPQGLLTQ